MAKNYVVNVLAYKEFENLTDAEAWQEYLTGLDLGPGFNTSISIRNKKEAGGS